jgi:VanZ family protein
MKRSIAKFYIPVIAWAILIIIGSSIPDLGNPVFKFTFSDKFEHIGEYSFFGFFLAYAFFKSRPMPAFIMMLIICAAFGVSDELHQLFVPGRTCDPFDALADVIGSAVGIWIYIWLKNKYSCLSFRPASSHGAK